MTMAEQIIRARKKAGLTQRELAKQLNVTNKAVSRWETGGGMPDIIQLVPLCRVLDLSLQELLDGVEEGLGKQFISSLLIRQIDENKNINTETSIMFLYVLRYTGICQPLHIFLGIILSIHVLVYMVD